jgi:hypothetical protein
MPAPIGRVEYASVTAGDYLNERGNAATVS